MKAIYFTQCNILRRAVNGEALWEALMAGRTAISQEACLALADLSAILEDGEELSEYLRADPDAGCYVSNVAGRPYVIVQNAGFEFFFHWYCPDKKI